MSQKNEATDDQVDAVVDNISQLMLSGSGHCAYESGPKTNNLDCKNVRKDLVMKSIQDIESSIKKPKPSYLVEDRKGLLDHINSVREEMTRKLQHLKPTAKKGKSPTSTIRKEQLTGTIADRLIDSQKKMNERKGAQMIKKIKEECAGLKEAPGISAGSKKLLLQAKAYPPIYTNERWQQISSMKKQHLDKIKTLVTSEKQFKENKDLTISIPNCSLSEIKESDLCFDPKSVRSLVFEKTPTRSIEETTEEQELRKNCTFKPATDRKSTLLFSKQNVRRKPVVDRLMDYGKYKDKALKERMAESRPSFTPRINNKSQELIKSTPRLSLAPQLFELEKIKYEETPGASQVGDVPKKQSVDMLKTSKDENKGEVEKDQKDLFTVTKLKEMLAAAGQGEGSVKDTSSAKSSVLAKYIP